MSWLTSYDLVYKNPVFASLVAFNKDWRVFVQACVPFIHCKMRVLKAENNGNVVSVRATTFS